MTLSGIEPATFHIVVHCLHQQIHCLCTAVPNMANVQNFEVVTNQIKSYGSCKWGPHVSAIHMCPWRYTVRFSTEKDERVFRSSCSVVQAVRGRPVNVEFLWIWYRRKWQWNRFFPSTSPVCRGELSYLASLGSENISAPYFKQCFFRGWGITPQTVKHHASQSQDRNNKYWCRIHLCFRLMGGLQAKSMRSQRNRAVRR